MELADKHMARIHPAFKEANNRMTEAYSKLFELEHFLRYWIEKAWPNWQNNMETNWLQEPKPRACLSDFVALTSI
jgi:hypothetical protein